MNIEIFFLLKSDMNKSTMKLMKSLLIRNRFKDINNNPPISKKSFFSAFSSNKKRSFYEKKIIDYFGARYGIFTKNGRLAIYLFLKAIGVKKDDEVILSAFNCFVVPEVILFLGAKPVYIDIDNYANINSTDLRGKISSKTKCIILPYHDGIDVDHRNIFQAIKKQDIKILLDGAHILHSKSDNKEYSMANSKIDGIIYSFSDSKNISLNCGGLLITNNSYIGKEILDQNKKITSIKSVYDIKKIVLLFLKTIIGRYAYFSFLVKALGSNTLKFVESEILEEEYYGKMPINFISLLSNYKIKLLYFNLPNLANWNEKRRRNAKIYKDHLNQEIGYHLIQDIRSSIPLHYPLILNGDSDDIYYYLMKKNIYTERWFKPQLYPSPKDMKKFQYRNKDFPIANNLSKRVLSLPLSPILSSKEILKICDEINNFYLHRRFK